MSITYPEALDLRARLLHLPMPEGVDRAHFNALLTAGVRDVLLAELDALDEIRARKDAAVEVSQALQWGEAGRRIANRRQWLAANPWAKREAIG